MRMFLRMKCENFVLAPEIPCEWKFATKFASDCECDGVVHSGCESSFVCPTMVLSETHAGTSPKHWASCERHSREPLSEKGGVPSRAEGETIQEMLWRRFWRL